MTDIYLRKREPGFRRPIIFLAVFLIVAIGALAVLLSGRGGGGPPPEDETIGGETAEETEVAMAEPTVDADRPEAARPAEPALAAAAGGSDPGLRMLSRAKVLVEQGRLQDGREIALRLLEQSSDATARERARALLDEVNIELVMNPYDMPEKVTHVVRSGDTLGKLAQTYGTTVELIQSGNNLNGALIRVNDRLRILQGAFAIQVDLSDNLLTLTLNDRYFKTYEVGTGKYQKTPTGESKIVDRIKQPTWWQPDGRAVPFGHPDNVLGTHWLALDIKGYGIHGTWEPETVGKHESAGCIRLRNEDIEEMFALVPIGTPVSLVP
jgi:lipoprotein-anchoring transpeptidase ErfK/SrfK